MHSRRKASLRALVALVISGGLALAGCGGGSATPALTSVPAASGAPAASAAPSSDAPASAAPAGCAPDVAGQIKQHLAAAEVVSVTIIGGCHQAAISTSLAATDVAKGLAICDSAAEVGYTGGVTSITVTASTEKELAIGLKGSPCIGEP